MTIIAAADGSALGNPGPAGWAWYIDEDTWAAGGWAHGTNNMGELTAVLNLLESTRHVADQQLTVLCDSQYVINSVTKWRHGWKKKGWKKSDGKPVLNVEIMKALDRQLQDRDVHFEWVKGHAGHELNEAADERARAVATAFQRGQEPAEMPVGPGFPDVSDTDGQTPAPGPDQVGGRESSGDSADEPDLLAELAALQEDQHSTRIAQDTDPARVLVRLELALLTAGSGPGGNDAGDLVHEDFECVGRDGSAGGAAVFTAQSRDLECGTGEGELQLSSAIPLGSTAYQLNYRLSERSCVTRRTSLWIREDQHNEMGPWLLRQHQVTAET